MLPRMNKNVLNSRLKEKRSAYHGASAVPPTFSHSRTPAADKKPIATGCKCGTVVANTDASFSKSSSFATFEHESARNTENDISRINEAKDIYAIFLYFRYIYIMTKNPC